MAGPRGAVSFSMWQKPDFKHVVLTHKDYRSSYNAAILYAHYELSAADLKKETIKYLKQIDTKNPLLDRMKDMHENRFLTIGKYAFVVNQGGQLPPEVDARVLPVLVEIIEEHETKTVASSVKVKEEVLPDTVAKAPSIQDRLRERAKFVAGEIEGWIDEVFINKTCPLKTVEDFVNLFKEHELKSAHMPHLIQSFASRTEIIDQVIAGKDKDLNEAYSCYTKPEMKKMQTFYKNLSSACDMIKEVAKATRAPKTKKPMSLDKLVAKIKYKKEDAALGIASVSPSQLVGAKSVWIYNTKTRKLSHYVADDLLGPITVKGTALVGFNEEKSISKTLRKPAEQLAEFKKLTKVPLRTYMSTIKTVETRAQGRIGEDSIILKSDK